MLARLCLCMPIFSETSFTQSRILFSFSGVRNMTNPFSPCHSVIPIQSNMFFKFLSSKLLPARTFASSRSWYASVTMTACKFVRSKKERERDYNRYLHNSLSLAVDFKREREAPWFAVLQYATSSKPSSLPR